MLLEKDHLYHIYNQGNNRQKIFLSRDNYLFFLGKMKTHILPFADILAWCLMPNHFHWMIYVRETEISKNKYLNLQYNGNEAINRNMVDNAQISFNNSIGILLASYTRAVNKRENKSGSIFRGKTKAECLTQVKGTTPAYFNTAYGASIFIPDHTREYPQICFNYIHNNPIKAGLVKTALDWEYSSYKDICGIRNGKLINKERIKEFGLILP